MLAKIDLSGRFIKSIITLLLLLPLFLAVWKFNQDSLSANPVEALTHITGEWALRLLLVTLAVSPLRRIFRFNQLIHLRRIFGVTCFFYVLCHFLIYLILDQWLDWRLIIEDIRDRTYITVGFAAFLLMTPLALTSTNSMQRKLQANWNRLHKLIYVISILAILHFWWLVKADTREPMIYAFILAGLLGYRIYTRLTDA